jgi:poly(3-hydroxybutyrate) depolymerase
MPRLLRFCVSLRLRHALLSALALVVLGIPALADELPAGFHERVFRDETGDHKYLIFLPANYNPASQWPVILYLHGASARGTDNRLPILDGMAPHVRARANTFPFVVVFPQCEDLTVRHTDGWLAGTADAKRALRILDEVERDYSIDRHREILTGPSMGGVGAWSVACATPSRWSGVMVVSGSGNPADAAKLKDMPLWICHGEKDLAVSIDGDRRMVEAVRAAGGHPNFTVLPKARHIIAHVVYGDDAVYTWMLDPKSEPRATEIVANAERKPTQAELGFDINTNFVPAVEIPQAAYVRVGKDALESLTSTLPELMPPGALTGAMAGTQQSGRTALMSFQISIAGMSYRGQLERVTIDCRNDGWTVLHLGLRNLTLEIAQTQFSARFVSATAGPMYVMIAQQRPVWLNVPLKPYVDAGHLRFMVGTPDFSIPADDFQVTTPDVEAHGLPLMRREVSSRFREKLVGGAYERKPEIERIVVGAVPKLINQLETRLDQQLALPRTIAGWPMPALQPRFVLWADSVHVDESGLALIFGMTFSRPGLNPPAGEVRRIEARRLQFSDMPKTTGLQLGISRGVMQGITAAMMAAGPLNSDLVDLNPAGFAPFTNPVRLARMIPDLARFGDHLQARALANLTEPISVSSVDSKLPATTMRASGESDPQLAKSLAFCLPNVRLSIEIKTSPEAKWQPCVVADVTLRQELQLELVKTDFERRLVNLNAAGNADVTVNARFADGFQPQVTRLETDAIAQTFAEGWRTGAQTHLLRGIEARDLRLGSTCFRAADIGWLDPFTVKFFVPAHSRITNKTSQPVEYYIRVALSNWGGPYKLKPGQSHEYNAPYGLIIQYQTAGGQIVRNVPLGTQCVIGADAEETSAVTRTSEALMGTERR